MSDRSHFTEDISPDAREAAELLIIEKLIEDSIEIPDEPDRSMGIGESFGDVKGPKSIFICGRCDMIVHEDDRACEFCGAEFESVSPEEAEKDSLDRLSEERDDRLRIHASLRRDALSRMPSAEKVDVLGMLDDSRSKLGDEHIAGGTSNSFLNYAKVLRAIEGMISEAGEIGVETGEARKALLAAWKACHEGKWDRAIQLAEESKRILAPGVRNLVESQLYYLRGAIVEMKRKGRCVAPLIVEMKTIQNELSDMRLDEAMRSTKSLIAEIKKIQMHILDNISSEDAAGEDRTTYRGQWI